jgi:hypothetical protein
MAPCASRGSTGDLAARLSLRPDASLRSRGAIGRTIQILMVCVLGLVAAPGLAGDDDYPADITPPPGTQYPCALTPLPRGLPGIPEGDRGYINRTYARILRATQAKLVALRALEDERGVAAALATFDARVAELVESTRAEPAPPGLAPFQADVVGALELQRRFFTRAGPVRLGGGSMQDVYAVPEGRQASGHLIAAWEKMRSRYPGWDAATRDSIYHHLCALDLF